MSRKTMIRKNFKQQENISTKKNPLLNAIFFPLLNAKKIPLLNAIFFYSNLNDHAWMAKTYTNFKKY